MNYLYWTGGWDSTFRLCQLLVDERKEVQPIYIACPIDSRRSIKQELNTMVSISSQLVNEYPYTRELLRPTMMVNKIEPNPEVTMSGNWIMKTYQVGYQYEKLCRYSIQFKKPIEIGISLTDHPARVHFIIEHLEGFGEDCRMIKDCPPRLWIYRNIRFPIIHLNKHQMRDIARKNGYYEILCKTWSCRTPWEGKPCGRCPSCRERIVKVG